MRFDAWWFVERFFLKTRRRAIGRILAGYSYGKVLLLDLGEFFLGINHIVGVKMRKGGEVGWKIIIEVWVEVRRE